MLRPPANLNDFVDHPELRPSFDEIWNRPVSQGGQYCGAYVDSVVASSQNYVDPRVDPPMGNAVKIPWNGFPRLMSRYFDDEISPAAREAAEAAADILTEVVYYVIPTSTGLRVGDSLVKDLPARSPTIQQLARPLRELNSDGTLGRDVRQFRRQQDEYLEWRGEVDTAGQVVSITFTAEPPDYWKALAEISKDLV